MTSLQIQVKLNRFQDLTIIVLSQERSAKEALLQLNRTKKAA
jgi:hypothetical protein